MAHLTGRRALVTGGARGIGIAIVRRLAADGAMVALTYASSARESEALTAELLPRAERPSRFEPTQRSTPIPPAYYELALPGPLCQV